MNLHRALQLQIKGPDNKTYYGGNQEWFSSNTWAMGGCSTVAAANALRALLRNNKELRRDFITSKRVPRPVKYALCAKEPSKDDFSLLMTGVYKIMGTGEIPLWNSIYDRKKRGTKLFRYIKPTFGRSSIGFIVGIIRFAAQFGITIKVRTLTTAFCDSRKAKSFIEQGLNRAGAVVMLTSYNKMDFRLFPEGVCLENRLTGGADTSTRSHFTTITDMDGDRVLLTTWARAGVASFDQIAKSWKSIKAYESTLFYIETCDKKESRKCMLNAWKPFVTALIESIIRRNIENI